MTPLAQAIGAALVQFVWQGFLVSLVVSVVGLLLRKRGPGIRYLVYCTALFALAALPVVTAVTLYDPLSANKPGPAAITLTIRAVWDGSVSPFALYMEKWLDVSQPWVLRGWLFGVAFFSMRLAWLGARVASLRRSALPAAEPVLAAAAALARRMRTTRAVRVLVSALPDGPGVVGWVRPVILLPAATILNLTPQQLEAILAHEIAHLRRYDDVVNIAQSLIETLLFYHPAVWWVSNRIRQERELCCDDLAVRASGDALCYARALTALETLRARPPVALALGATTSPLEYRIRRIVGERAQGRLPSALPGLLALGMTLVCVAIYSPPAHGRVRNDRGPLPPALVEYPESARASGIEGTVPVEVKIDRQGHVSGAKAMGGPRELRQAAVDSASALHFAPDVASPKQVNVAFELDSREPSSPPAAPALVVDSSPRSGPRWRDKGEAIIGLAAGSEKDPSRQLDLLNQWEQLYPASELKAQRIYMTTHALLAVLGAAYGKTDPTLLDEGKKAAEQLSEHFDEYLDDSLRPETLTPEA